MRIVAPGRNGVYLARNSSGLGNATVEKATIHSGGVNSRR